MKKNDLIDFAGSSIAGLASRRIESAIRPHYVGHGGVRMHPEFEPVDPAGPDVHSHRAAEPQGPEGRQFRAFDRFLPPASVQPVAVFRRRFRMSSVEYRSGFQHENAVAGCHLASAIDEMDRLLDQMEERRVASGASGYTSGYASAVGTASSQNQPHTGTEQRPRFRIE